MRNVSDKTFGENQNAPLCSVTFSENGVVYKVMWTNIIEPDKPHKTIWGMHFARYLRLQTHIYNM